MKHGILMILALLLTTLWMIGCDAVGDNEPNVSRETLERIRASPQDLPSSPDSWLVVGSKGYMTTANDTTKD